MDQVKNDIFYVNKVLVNPNYLIKHTGEVDKITLIYKEVMLESIALAA